MGNNSNLVNECPSIRCTFYPYRFGKIPDVKPKTTPLKSIRLYCLECVETSDEVRKCSMPECPVYYYRFGKNPSLKGKRGIGNPKVLENWRLNKVQEPFCAVESILIENE
jgi:hypothetical protein